jgi:hypothetical protein
MSRHPGESRGPVRTGARCLEPAPAPDSDPGFAGMTSVAVQMIVMSRQASPGFPHPTVRRKGG